MLKRIWHAITGNHEWYLRGTFMPVDMRTESGFSGYTELRFECECGAQIFKTVDGLEFNSRPSDKLRLRKMAGLK